MRAQQLGLRRKRQIADLVEKQGAAVGVLELARRPRTPVAVRSSMPKSSASSSVSTSAAQLRRRTGRAVGADLVDLTGDQLFAGAALPSMSTVKSVTAPARCDHARAHNRHSNRSTEPRRLVACTERTLEGNQLSRRASANMFAEAPPVASTIRSVPRSAIGGSATGIPFSQRRRVLKCANARLSHWARSP